MNIEVRFTTMMNMANKATSIVVVAALLGLLLVADAARFDETMIKRITSDGPNEQCVPEAHVQNVGYQTGCIPGTQYKCCEGSYCEPRYYRGFWTFYCAPCESARDEPACHNAIGQ